MKTFLLRIMQGMMLVSLVAACLLIVGFFKGKKVELTASENKLGCGTFCGNRSSYQGVAGIDGKAIFQINCASCHRIDADLTGPALSEANLWLPSKKEKYAWVRSCDSVWKSSNKRAIAFRKKYGTKCLEFPSLTDAQIDELFLYLKSYN